MCHRKGPARPFGPVLVMLWLLLVGPVRVSDAQEAALLFDGVDDIVTVPSPVGWPFSTSGLTVEAWIRPDDTSDRSLRGIVEGQNFVLTLDYGDNTAAAFSIAIGPTDAAVTPSGSLDEGRWDHVAGTYDGTTIRIYLNGVLVGSTTQPVGGPVGISGDVNIGFWVGAYGFPGTIDEVRIWDTVHTQEEIARLMVLPLSGSEANLIGYWRFDDGAGQIASDSCALANDGTLGATTASEPDDPQWTLEVAPIAFFFDGFEDGTTDAWSATVP